jgi:hypothetical protein
VTLEPRVLASGLAAVPPDSDQARRRGLIKMNRVTSEVASPSPERK